ncbi:MAG: type II toxin-antitoxin system RelE/ParE family toxin [Actinobacteria bacterium]|nr:type II toxin-antitoxin system RelE/ParE family toxin [Actinomycetota bacterium]
MAGGVWGLRLRPRQLAVRLTYWCKPDGTIVFLTVFRKTRQHEQRQIDRAVRAQQVCATEHERPPIESYERQV